MNFIEIAKRRIQKLSIEIDLAVIAFSETVFVAQFLHVFFKANFKPTFHEGFI
jgi:hypothetical protein